MSILWFCFDFEITRPVIKVQVVDTPVDYPRRVADEVDRNDAKQNLCRFWILVLEALADFLHSCGAGTDRPNDGGVEEQKKNGWDDGEKDN